MLDVRHQISVGCKHGRWYLVAKKSAYALMLQAHTSNSYFKRCCVSGKNVFQKISFVVKMFNLIILWEKYNCCIAQQLFKAYRNCTCFWKKGLHLYLGFQTCVRSKGVQIEESSSLKKRILYFDYFVEDNMTVLLFSRNGKQ